MFWQLAHRMTDSAKSKGQALSFTSFFMGSGFGFVYFSRQCWKSFAASSPGFYTTPTNFCGAENIEWVNPIVDLLIPLKRATLFGWCVRSFPAVYLLWRFCYEGKRRLWPWLALLALPLPGLLHTHSALALVLLCLVGGVYLAQGCTAETLLPWLELAAVLKGRGVAGADAAHRAGPKPERSARCGCTSNWINGQDDGTLKDNYFWFYIKNIGLSICCWFRRLSTPSPNSGGSTAAGWQFWRWRSLLCSSPTTTTITNCFTSGICWGAF